MKSGKGSRKGLEGFVKTILIEPCYICKDYRNLYSNFYSKKFLERSAICNRLHFFSTDGLSVGDILDDPETYREAYLGYSVIQPVRDRCIGRTVIDPMKIGHDRNTFFCLRTKTSVRINGTKYEVEGYPYMSQSGEATVCAHAALRGVCRYLSDRYPNYRETYSYDLIAMTGNTSGRRVPYRGMSYEDYSEILVSFGTHPVIIKPRTDQTKWTEDPNAFFDIYAYMESGFPVLVSFNGHVAAVIGHTVGDNLGIHQPENARFYNSFTMVKQFVVVDDNCFPYALLGYPKDPSDPGEDENYGSRFTTLAAHQPSINSIYAAVIPLPEKAFLPPDTARRLCYKYFDHADARRLTDDVLKDLKCLGEPLVARQFLTTANSFKRRKKQCATGELGGQPDKLALLPVDLVLPHFMWVMEISPLSLYKQGFCVGEVVLDASASEDESEYIYMRVGKTALRGNKVKPFAPGLLRFPQYTHNLGERDA